MFKLRFACLFLLIGCSRNADTRPPAAASDTNALAKSAPSIQAANPMQEDAVNAGGLAWTAPKPFVPRPPKSTMRVAEYGVPGDDATELAVFFFGADQGGGVEPNMARWVGQFQQPDGSETKAKRTERTVKGITISLVEATGTYSGGMAMPGMPPKDAQPNSALLGAIANGPGGLVFFKLIGPKSQIDSLRPAFDGLIESLHPLH
ncbi:MAG TPA: hypothetical protein VHZ95_01975 [Polyangiales bacterium]|nr:hypothetical protein [Polyangiales bacterium]